MGGCIIALAKDLEHAKIIAEELKESGASNSWYFSTASDRLYDLQQ